MKRKNWLSEAYQDYFSTQKRQQPSGPKTYLLKLIEFNKISLVEKPIKEDWWCTSAEVESDLIEI